MLSGRSDRCGLVETPQDDRKLNASGGTGGGAAHDAAQISTIVGIVGAAGNQHFLSLVTVARLARGGAVTVGGDLQPGNGLAIAVNCITEGPGHLCIVSLSRAPVPIGGQSVCSEMSMDTVSLTCCPA